MTELINLFKNDYKKISSITNNFSDNDIFEINLETFQISDTLYKSTLSFYSYHKLLKYLMYLKRINNLNIINLNQLDIEYSVNKTTYIITITNNAAINHYINILKDKSNLNIFTILLKEIQNGKKNVLFYKKEYTTDTDIKLTDFDMTVRRYKKSIVNQQDIINIQNIQINSDNLKFKLKNKLVINDENIYIQLSKVNDSSIGLTFNTITNTARFNPIDELYMIKVFGVDTKKNHFNETTFMKIFNYTEKLLKVIQTSSYIISTKTQNEVLQKYQELLDVNPAKKSLKANDVVSIEIQHMNDLTTKYAVTDKADGEHAFLIIKDTIAYIITQNLNVINTGIEVDKKYNDTILDGERIFIKSKNKWMFMVFDCLYSCGEKTHENPILLERLKEAEKIIKNCFVTKNQKYSENNYDHKKTNIVDILKFYNKEIIEYFKILIEDLEKTKYMLIRPKYFMFPIGCIDNEIYQYSKLLWNIYKSIDYYPYNLDGMVYQPINQSYYNPALKLIKWKPEENNTIDFYIEFERDPKTNKIMLIYDNLIDVDDDLENNDKQPTKHVSEVLYKICKLYVGHTVSTHKDQPVIFNPQLHNPNHSIHIAYLPVDEHNNVIDSEGGIIQDKSVVEFSYKNNNNIAEKYRWTPLRTRYDKTEQVNKNQIKYGNKELTAYKIWGSIHYPITFNDIEILSDMNKYYIHKNELMDSAKEYLLDESYYNKDNEFLRGNLDIKIWGHFQNMMKTFIINTYCKPEFNNNKKVNVIDIGFGTGDDMLKYFNAEVSRLTGLEPNYNNISLPAKGAKAQYFRYRRKYPNFFPVQIINSTFTLPLDYDKQEMYIVDKSPDNKERFIKYLSNFKYDIVSCMFSFHYFLENEQSWNNTCDNINRLLKDDGYLIITCLDAHRIEKVLKENNGKYDQYLTINNEKIPFHSIHKMFDEYQKIYKYGNKINIKISTFMNDYISEYLVDDNFIIPELNKKCNLQLIETDYYENIYDNMKDYILTVKDVEQKENMRKFLYNQISKFYESNENIDECKKVSFLDRYYVFKKISK